MIIQKAFIALAMVAAVSAVTLTPAIAEARGARSGGHFSTHGGHYGYRAPYGEHYGYRVHVPYGYGYRPYFSSCAYVNAWGQCVRSSYRYGW
jgi:hypothetical protein